jgi:hypothetical protein
LKTVIEQQKQHEEKLVIDMSQTILQKEQELQETIREMRYLLTPSVQEELHEAYKRVLHDMGRETAVQVRNDECHRGLYIDILSN